MLSFNSNGTNNISGKRTQFLQIKVDQDSDDSYSSEKDLSDSIDLGKIVCRWAKLPKTKRIINVKAIRHRFIFDLD